MVESSILLIMYFTLDILNFLHHIFGIGLGPSILIHLMFQDSFLKKFMCFHCLSKFESPKCGFIFIQVL
jgi:hypothetical protein